MLGMRGVDLGLHGDDLGLNGDLLCSDGRRRERDLSRGGDCIVCGDCLHHEFGHGQKVAVAVAVSLYVLHGLQLGAWKRGGGGVGMWNQGAFRGVRLPRVPAATLA